jgi:hypothetical protein
VFGTDYPFGSTAKHLQGLKKRGFGAMDLQGIHSRQCGWDISEVPELTKRPESGRAALYK